MDRPREHPRPSVRLLCAVLVGICVLLGTARTAFAHAVLVNSSPKADAVVQGPTTDIVLQFNSRVDAARSSLTLETPDGKPQALPADLHAAPNVLRSSATHLVKGSYSLHWQVLSSDGHITRGAFSFSVR